MNAFTKIAAWFRTRMATYPLPPEPMSESDFWFERCNEAFFDAMKASSEGRFRDFQLAEQRHKLCHRRFRDTVARSLP